VTGEIPPAARGVAGLAGLACAAGWLFPTAARWADVVGPSWPGAELRGRPCLLPARRHRRIAFLGMIIARSILLFVVAALAEIGGAWLIWQGVREHRGLLWVSAGVIALGLYGFVATLQADPNFGRILAAYGGVFVAGSLAWGMVVEKFRPDRWDIAGAVICLVGVVVIMYAPRAT